MNTTKRQDILHNINIDDEEILITPAQLKLAYPISNKLSQQIEKSRIIIADIIHRRDNRQLIIVGPCSIHDPQAAIDYGKKLKALSEKLEDKLYIVMRVYFEKPRTTIGWKGLINDPKLNGSFDIETGLKMARSLLINLSELGLPLATEALDPITPQYLADLFSWSAIGARTKESQTHREMASGLSMAVGFKNGTDGNLAVAINAMQAAAEGHSFLGINQQGQVNILHTKGNPNGHIILRGGKTPNYQQTFVAECEQLLAKMQLPQAIMIDCSHGNSLKDYRRQPLVLDDVLTQLQQGNRSIIGVMFESHLNAGQQSADQPFSDMEYGVSITDGCIDWQTTERILTHFAENLPY